LPPPSAQSPISFQHKGGYKSYPSPPKSFPRNKSLAEIFRDAGLIERYGSGIKRALDQFREYKLREPAISEKQGGLEVVVYNVPKMSPKCPQ
jgi:predicted HTH transcriptional regulator